MSWHFEQVAGPYSRLTEGPAWDGSALLFTDIPNSRIMRYDPGTGETTIFRDHTNGANGLMFNQQGELFACEGDARRVVRYNADGTSAVIADRYEGKRLNSPNDLAVDAQGRVWFTDPCYGSTEHLELDHDSVYRVDPQPDGNWQIQRMTFDTTKPNGLLISPDQKTLYVAQSEYGDGKKRELRAYLIREDGMLGEYQVLHNFYPHRGIDGMCLDVEGNIIACAGWELSGPGPMIYVFAPNGRVLETHPIDNQRPTNCTFGDADLQTLYVTGMTGCLHRVRTQRKGCLVYP